MWVGGGGLAQGLVSDCLPLAAPIGLSPLLIVTLRGPERVLVVSTEPPDDLSCLTTPGVGCPRGGGGGGRGWPGPQTTPRGSISNGLIAPAEPDTVDGHSSAPVVVAMRPL